MLYFRMMVTMVISFYTTRVVLNALGVVDYGLVNVIGSAVSMFSFLSISLSTAASRFFNYQLGRGNALELQRTFSMILLLYGGLFVLLLVLSETVGLWVFRTKLVIPPERLGAATWFFHASIATLLIGLWSVPFQAMVISYENMRVYAWVSVFEAIAKLIIVYCLTLCSFDRLKLYGILLNFVSLIHLLIYMGFCRANYPETRYVKYFSKAKFRQIIVFSGWNMFGTAAWASSDIFLNLLLNNFFGPIVNAARGVAMQVASGTSAFTQNFLTAVRPQIVKYWASDDYEQFKLLFRRASKMGFFLLFALSLPVLLETEFIFRLWLGKVPEYTVCFTRLILITGLINSFSFPLTYGAQATGHIALFEGVGSGVRFLILPAAWIVLRMGYGPETALWVGLIGTGVCVIARLIIFSRLTNYPVIDFIVKVLVPCVLVAVGASWLPILIRSNMVMGWPRLVSVGLAGVVMTAVAIYTVGLERGERLTLSRFSLRLASNQWSRIVGRLCDT